MITGCTLAIAATGTFVLDGGPGQGPRRLTLVPDLHVCVVREDQIVPGVPQAVAALREAAAAGRPLTFVSGPSATSDIELDRVEGVHGPRRLEVVLVANRPRKGNDPPKRAVSEGGVMRYGSVRGSSRCGVRACTGSTD